MKILYSGLLATKIGENIPLVMRNEIIKEECLFSMVFIPCYKKSFKEKRHDVFLSNY